MDHNQRLKRRSSERTKAEGPRLLRSPQGDLSHPNSSGALDVAGKLLLVAALSVSDLALVSAIAAITPVVAAVLAITFLGERVNRWQVVGLALGLVGVWLVILS